jgi:hypothetical protein
MNRVPSNLVLTKHAVFIYIKLQGSQVTLAKQISTNAPVTRA